MAIPERKVTGPATLPPDEPETFRRLKTRMAPVEFKVAVTGTGKGVGVSTFTWNLALALRHREPAGEGPEHRRAPSIGILDLSGRPSSQWSGPKPPGRDRRASRYLPVRGPGGVRVVSLNTLTEEPLMPGGDWRSVQASLAKVEWKGLDLLLIEFPPEIETAGDLSEVFPAVDAAFILSRPGNGERDRIRRIWRFFDASSVPAIGLVSNMEGRHGDETVEELGRVFGIPIRVAIPYEPQVATHQAAGTPYILARSESKLSRVFFDLSEELVDYLMWLHDEHEQEEDF